MPTPTQNSDLKTVVKQYNQALKDHPKQIDTIFSDKYSNLLGETQPAYEQIKAIRAEREERQKSNQLNVLEIAKDRLTQQQVVNQQYNKSLDALNTNDDKLNTYLENKGLVNEDKIQTLQDTINTRDKIIYLNNKDAYDKQILIKTLMIVLLLSICLATISLLYFSKTLSEIQATGIAIIVTVIFVYRIMRTYYWRPTVHVMDEVTDVTSASLRKLFGDKDCPTCDNLDYCTDAFAKAKSCGKDLCKEEPKNLCCAKSISCDAYLANHPDFCANKDNANKNPKQYHTCCVPKTKKHNSVILHDNTNMNLL